MNILKLFIFSLIIVLIFNLCQYNSDKKYGFIEEMSKANTYYEKGEYKLAFSIYNSLIRKDSLNGEICYKMGFCKVQLSDDESSKKDFKNAIRFNYRVKDAYLNLGVLECFYNDSLAIKYFDVVLDMDSADIKANMYRKEAMKRLKRKNKTIEL